MATGSYRLDDLKALMRRVATKIMDEEGLVRRFEYMGVRNLPYRMRHAEHHAYRGTYWQVLFFAKPDIAERMRKPLKHDPDIIRSTIILKTRNLRDMALLN